MAVGHDSPDKKKDKKSSDFGLFKNIVDTFAANSPIRTPGCADAVPSSSSASLDIDATFVMVKAASDDTRRNMTPPVIEPMRIKKKGDDNSDDDDDYNDNNKSETEEIKPRGLSLSCRGKFLMSSKEVKTYASKDRAASLSTRSNRYGNNNSSSSNNIKTQQQQRCAHANERLLDELISQAEFELNHDPYRGMMLAEKIRRQQRSDNSPDAPRNPWKDCLYTPQKYKENSEKNKKLILNLNNCTKDDMDGTELAQAWVEETWPSHCTSLMSWTQCSILKERQSLKKKKNKKRKLTDTEIKPPHVGQRPGDVNTRCPCDYNPYCTATMGGVLDDILQTRAEELFRKKKKQHEHLEEMWRIQRANVNGTGGDIDASRFDDASGTLVEGSNDDATMIDVKESPEAATKATKTVVSISDVEVIEDETTEAITQEHDIELSPDTAGQLNRLRPCTMVQAQPIRDYLDSLLRIAPAKLAKRATVDELLNIFNRWQSSLIFSNPLRDDLKPTSTTLPIALPPGISNLGATCYLNTQLQCLAQNKAFLKGIVSWRPSDANADAAAGEATARHNNVMNSVLTQMQSLLVKMVEGSERTMNTLEFSTALGLEHDEQQDPNEFARLLFERMHEAFQQHPSLKTLLPSLFEGNTTYVTKCLKCGSTSTRRESFMDLNLPIVQPVKEGDSDGEKKGKGFGSKIFHFFAKVTGKDDEPTSLPNAYADTDLQFCLDQYSTYENLEGENQYFCSNCNCKQDATRKTALETLPPVLNVQLSRYVFDRATLMKKKLTDKVLLPQKLQVDTTNSSPGGNMATFTKTYVLCAVMKHQGNSAYRGHYVAEVQDFLTGKWWNFNDERVTLLGNGPSCSYMPSHLDSSEDEGTSTPDEKETKQGEDSKKKAPKLSGSEDAYNMYYVEESFLAKTTLEAFEAIHKQQEELEAVIGKKKEPSQADILQKIAFERRGLYWQLTNLCLADGRINERLRVRENQLRSDMLSLLTSKSDDNGSPVWVDAELLRKFVSCKDRLDDLFRTPPGEPLLRHKHLLCHHATPGLPPRIARRGKLLPRPVYESYLRLLAKERCRFLEEDDEVSPNCKEKNIPLWTNLYDCEITPEHSLSCEECSKSYRSDLEPKLQMVKLLRCLYVDLDPKAGKAELDIFDWHDSDSEYEETASNTNGDPNRYAYVVPKKFLTAFRKKIETHLLRPLTDVAATTSNSSPPPAGAMDIDVDFEDNQANKGAGFVHIDSLSEGLDALELSAFDFRSATDELDVTINASITCPHGNCTVAYKKQVVKWLSPDAWENLKTVFPNAIEHKLLRSGSSNGKNGSRCDECDKHQKCQNDLEAKLEKWYNESLSRGDRDESLKLLYREPKKDHILEDIFDANKKSDGKECLGGFYPEEYVLVARSDLALWRKMMAEAGKLKGKKSDDGYSIKKQLEELLSARSTEWMKHVGDHLEDSLLRALKCKRHGMTAAIFQKTEDSDSARLTNRVTLLTVGQYDSFVASMADICKTLASEDSGDDVIDLCEISPTKMSTLPTRLKPPTLRITDLEHHMELDSSERILLEAPGGPPISLTLYPARCTDEECCRQFGDAQDPDDEVQDMYGSAADDPIVLESDTEEANGTFQMKVFEVAPIASVDTAITSLTEMQALSCVSIGSPGEDGPRRSSRKRKTRFPVGVILRQDSVDVALHHNLAAVRLLLMQTCEAELNQNLFLIFTPQNSAPAEPSSLSDFPPENIEQVEPRIMMLPLDSNEKLLKDIYVSGTNDPDLERLGDPAISLVLLRQDPGSTKSRIPHEALMDVLLETANTISNDDESKNGGKNKPAERGFRGTLLSSFRSSTTDPSDKEISKEDKSSETGGTMISCESTVLDAKAAEESKSQPSPKRADVPLAEESTSAASPKRARVETKKEPIPRNGNSHSKSGEEPEVPSMLEQLDSRATQVTDLARKVKELIAGGGQDEDEELIAIRAAQWAVENCAFGATFEQLTNSAMNKVFEASSS